MPIRPKRGYIIPQTETLPTHSYQQYNPQPQPKQPPSICKRNGWIIIIIIITQCKSNHSIHLNLSCLSCISFTKSPWYTISFLCPSSTQINKASFVITSSGLDGVHSIFSLSLSLSPWSEPSLNKNFATESMQSDLRSSDWQNQKYGSSYWQNKTIDKIKKFKYTKLPFNQPQIRWKQYYYDTTSTTTPPRHKQTKTNKLYFSSSQMIVDKDITIIQMMTMGLTQGMCVCTDL